TEIEFAEVHWDQSTTKSCPRIEGLLPGVAALVGEREMKARWILIVSGGIFYSVVLVLHHFRSHEQLRVKATRLADAACGDASGPGAHAAPPKPSSLSRDMVKRAAGLSVRCHDDVNRKRNAADKAPEQNHGARPCSQKSSCCGWKRQRRQPQKRPPSRRDGFANRLTSR